MSTFNEKTPAQFLPVTVALVLSLAFTGLTALLLAETTSASRSAASSHERQGIITVGAMISD